MQAVLLVRKGWSIRKVARYLGFSHGAIINWIKKAPLDGREKIPTRSSRPKHHPRTLKPEIIEKIVSLRLKHRRCAEVVHQELLRQGVAVSLSSVKRTLDRRQLLRKSSPWKKLHKYISRPEAKNAGDLVEIDTIQIRTYQGERFYVYTLLDVASRWAYAKVSPKINTRLSFKFLKEAIAQVPFKIRMLQSDHGSEFSKWFSNMISKHGLIHRHSRVRQPNDNGHLERFNRTIQEEAFIRLTDKPRAYQLAINKYLPYYNTERLHMGINYLTPIQVVRSY
jgi:transposase InsO family protein